MWQSSRVAPLVVRRLSESDVQPVATRAADVPTPEHQRALVRSRALDERRLTDVAPQRGSVRLVVSGPGCGQLRRSFSNAVMFDSTLARSTTPE